MKTQILFALFAAVVLSGCHTCPPPEASMDCFPMCVKDKNKISRFSAENWKKFKTFRPLVYKTVGIPEIDDIGIRTSQMTIRIANEIIIPYVDLDKDGLIAVYYEFNEEVKTVAKQRNCSVGEAVKLVWQDWKRLPQGKEICPKLQRAMPLIQHVRAEGQIIKAVEIISPNVLSLIKDFLRIKKRLEYAVRMKKRGQMVNDIMKMSNAGLQIMPAIDRLKYALAYLWILKADQRAQEKEIENFTNSIIQLTEVNKNEK